MQCTHNIIVSRAEAACIISCNAIQPGLQWQTTGTEWHRSTVEYIEILYGVIYHSGGPHIWDRSQTYVMTDPSRAVVIPFGTCCFFFHHSSIATNDYCESLGAVKNAMAACRYYSRGFMRSGTNNAWLFCIARVQNYEQMLPLVTVCLGSIFVVILEKARMLQPYMCDEEILPWASFFVYSAN